MKRFYQSLSIVLAVLALGLAGGYYYSRSLAPRVLAAKFTPDDALGIGQETVFKVKFSMPWSARLGEIEVTPPANLIAGGTAQLEKSSVRFGYWIYTFSSLLRCGGAFAGEGTAGVAFEQNGTAGKLKIEFPPLAFVDTEPPSGSAPELAGEVFEPESFHLRPIHYIGLAVLLAAFLAWIFFRMGRRRDSGMPHDPRTWAMDELVKLEKAVKSGSIPLDYAVVRLSDIIREYLEERYRLPASRRTTEEFLGDLRRSELLDDKGKSFLKEFMNTGDLIKFAKAHLDEPRLLQALGDAENLVDTREEAKEAGPGAEK